MANISFPLINRFYYPSIKNDIINSFINYDTYFGIGFSVTNYIQLVHAGRIREGYPYLIKLIFISFLEQMTSNDHQDRKIQAFSFILGVSSHAIIPNIIRIIQERRVF